MKKYFIFAAAAVTFAACTEDVLIDNTKAPENNNEVAIGFGSDVNKLVMTRAENSTATETQGLENYHSTFRIWGYKNIKNPGTTTPATYTSTPVFDGDKNNEKTVATWSPAGNNTAPFNTKNDNLGGGDWVYSPVRYWDKTATNYDFHAAAPHMDSTQTNPIALDWQWKQINIDEDNNPTTTDFTPTTADAKGAGYFILGTADVPFKLNGESLPLANASVKNTSGEITSAKNVTTQPNDVFGGKKGTAPTDGWKTKDVDLMIAKDVLETPTNHSSKTTEENARVTFNFNHILSRLNIGVKIAGIAVKQMVNYDGDATKYLLYTASDGNNYIKDTNGKAQQVKLKADNKTIEKAKNSGGDDVDAQSWSDVTGIKVDDNVPNPTEGVVLLKDIEVVNLVTNGCFDEGVLAYKDDASKAMNKNDGTAGKPMVKPSELVNGTNLRWTFVTEPAKTSLKASDKISDNSTYGFPNEKVTGNLDGDSDNTMNLSKKFIVGKDTDDETEYTKNDYKMVFQGLVIPQVAKFEDVPVDGSTKGTQPYIKIVYSLDGEEFTNYYNLAEVFSNVLAPYTITKTETDGTTTTYTAYYTSDTNNYVYKKGTDDVYVNKDFSSATVSTKYYFDGEKYYQKNDTEEKYQQLDSKPTDVTGAILKCTATLDEEATGEYKYTIKVLAPVTRKEADLDGVAETECDITFCEGWQNNLWITIHPTAILFDADVYKWDTKYNEYEYPVE